MVEKQERDLRRDGLLFLVGVTGLAVLELGTQPTSAREFVILREFLFGSALGILLSGVFRATDKQALVSTLCLAVGFAVGGVINVF
ncbi:hypothetical protein C453_08828 [Haloferax elongans ATCC BAA-1513]|uniref:Uncharacterized protein n=1 Tax=Haloferax elongans ATCC BAA-1513 TaxID=1230453 RepID=M0HQB8_HALEO|nr:hypothetical protein [Haloferax elongans]ELZ85907.1 hypothetical protein C453_08828 [Haloferax elongans ATCC BAA-1513]